MASEERKNLIDQANALGLEFPKNISTKKLQAMVDESAGPAVKPEEPAEVAEAPAADEPVERIAPSAPMSKSLSLRQRIAEAKKKAFATRVVTITNKDNRENSFTTTVHLSFENQHFGLSKIVPLDIPVELEQALINLAENTMMTLHKDEIVDGKRTGNKVAVTVKKFAISYAK